MKLSIPDFFNAFLGGRLSYSGTKNLSYMSQVLTGSAQFLSPDNWDAYNVYLTTPQLYAVIQRRGYLLASGQWKHYKTVGGKPTLIENSPFVNLLENPNIFMNGNDLIRQWNENKCIYGNNYEFVNRSASMLMPQQLTNLPPAQIEINTTGKIYRQKDMSEVIKNYKLDRGDTSEIFETNEINHTRVVNGKNPIKGESPMIPIYMPISNIRASYEFRNVIMNKKGALGILSNNSKDSQGAIPLSPQERERLEKEYHRIFGIQKDKSQVIMTNSSLSWQAMTFPTKDLMLFEEVSADFNSIIDQYGLNDNLFTRDKGATYENLSEGMKQAYQSTIIPEAEELAMNRSKLFGLVERGEWLELDYSHIPALQENLKEKAEVLEKKANAFNTLLQTGSFTIDELKEVINLK
jgi:phage portal protein BeeE